ncbi:unnamed protein product [Clavelina lepadiformis]|uniref:Uncharacterized protein n=1 Tax=Clavelina lepadiformis TaxID=159417 RepID=A0ABP0GEE8_CLALP
MAPPQDPGVSTHTHGLISFQEIEAHTFWEVKGLSSTAVNNNMEDVKETYSDPCKGDVGEKLDEPSSSSDDDKLLFVTASIDYGHFALLGVALILDSSFKTSLDLPLPGNWE